MRPWFLAFSGAVFAAGLAMCVLGLPPGGAVAFWGGLLLVAALVERWRYRPATRADAQWEDTGERFIDPASGREMAVSFDRRTGQRRYVPLDGRPIDE